MYKQTDSANSSGYIIVRVLKIEHEQRLFKLKTVHQTGLSLKTLQKIHLKSINPEVKSSYNSIFLLSVLVECIGIELLGSSQQINLILSVVVVVIKLKIIMPV